MKLPRSLNNWTSLIGTILASVSFALILFLIAVSFFIEVTSSYLGLVIYIILPVFLITGLILISVGMAVKMRKTRKSGVAARGRWPEINLNLKQHRTAFSIFVITTALFIFLSAIGTYEAFHYTESTEFCGELCHKVMHPEYITYQNSSHANVACVDCHVGSGADWYVRSKLSGLYQVYSVLFEKYEQPIPTPIHNLRPARETCERCHWPEQFYAQTVRTERHYLADAENTEWDIILKMKVGSEYHALGLQEGIHWHINPDVKIEYMPGYEDRSVIPWVKYTNTATGVTEIYRDDESEVDPETEDLEVREMDCMDCHNRPSHEYFSPPFFTDISLTKGDIPRELPDVKQVAMTLLYDTYPTTDTAMMVIENDVKEYYELMYEDIMQEKPELIDRAIKGIQQDFRENLFPEMNARWDSYPNHVGHINSDGCFRCHNDRHRSASGRIISKDCNLCHTIVAQGTPEKLLTAGIRDTLEFIHPVDIGDAWKEFHCVDCHRYLY